MFRRTLCVTLAVAMLAFAPAALADATRGFDTPEACARAAFEAISTQDTAAIDVCFAFPELARQFDYQKYCEHLNSIVSQITLLPATSPANIFYNESKLRRDFYYRLCFSTLALNRPQLADFLGSGVNMPMESEDAAQTLALLLEASVPGSGPELVLDRLADPSEIAELSQVYNTPRNQASMQKQMAYWGVTEYRELVLVLRATESTALSESGLFLLPLRFIRVDGRWLAYPNPSTASMILGISNYFLMMPYTP